MKFLRIYWTAIIFMVVLFCAPSFCFCQDTTRTEVDSSTVVQEPEEQVLSVISIIAVVDKPSVVILPRRVKPKFESAPFLTRDFNKELKEVPAQLLTVDEELESAKKIKKLKKILVKNKK